MASIGRNDPCPCGSGRKYKHCCLNQHTSSASLRLRLRQAEGRLLPAVVQFAIRRWTAELMADAWAEWTFWSEDLPDDPAEDPHFAPLFLPWFLFSYIPDPNDDDPLPDAPTVTLGEAYLNETEDELDAFDREFLKSAAGGTFSFYTVRHITRGESISLTDILTGSDVQALEPKAAEGLSPGEILFARPVSAGGATVLLGVAPYVIPPAWHNRIIDFRESLWEGRRPTPDDVADADPEIREFLFAILEAIVDPKPPTLTNTDGEPIQLTELTYDLRCSVDEAFAVFKNLDPNPATEDDKEDFARGDDGALTRAVVRWLNDKEMLLGTVIIEPGVLRAEVNSAERAERITQEIAARLGARAVLVGTDILPADQLAQVTDADLDAIDDDPLERAPELAAAEGEVMAKYWEKWLDEPVPALANDTPRQAATTPLGRERLEALFSDYAWRAEQVPPHARPDIRALRQKLGV